MLARRAALDALPVVAFSAAPDGSVGFVNQRWREVLGGAPDVLAQAGIELIAAHDRERARALWLRSVTTGEPYTDEARVQVADGSLRWMVARAEPIRDPGSGAIVEWFGTLTDVDDQHRAGEARDTFAALVENSADFIGIGTLAGDISYVNDAGRALLEIGTLEDALRSRLSDYFRPEDLPYFEQVIMPALAREGRWTGDFRFRNFRTGEAVPVWYNLFHIRDPRSGEPVAIATVSADIRERVRSERRLRTLVDAGAALSHTLDYAQTLENLADLVVRTIATFCVIDLFPDDAGGARTIRRIAAVHADRAKRPLMARMRAYSPPTDLVAHPTVQVFRDSSSTLVPLVDEDWIARVAASPEHAEAMRSLELRSLLTVPLVANGRVLGALTCGVGEPAVFPSRPPAYDAEDLFFVEELGRRAGAAIENARLYERERRIAVSLQAASLPRTLPQAEHLRLDAEYRPGRAEATIGGDWYDAFALDDGRIALTIGDVLGNGLHAAITMTKLRQAMQSAAMVDPDPNLMLDVADKTLRMHDPDGYATALAAIYDPRAQILTFASAGHPGPALRTPDGRVEEFSSPGLLLGLRSGADHGTVTIPIPTGSLLVFYTDGLIEATRDWADGQRRLHAALSSSELMREPHPARAIVEAVLTGAEAGDDIAVLTALIVPLPAALSDPPRR